MDVSVGTEPAETVEDELDGLGVGEVHHQPVGEDEIHAVGLHLEVDGVSDLVVDIAQVGISLLVLGDERLDEVGRQHPAGRLGEDSRETAKTFPFPLRRADNSPYPGPDIHDVLVGQVRQAGEDVRAIGGLQILGRVVQHHAVGVRPTGEAIPEILEAVATDLGCHIPVKGSLAISSTRKTTLINLCNRSIAVMVTAAKKQSRHVWPGRRFVVRVGSYLGRGTSWLTVHHVEL